MLNDALLYQSYEIIGGEKFMAPAANPFHGRLLFKLGLIMEDYTYAHKNGYVFTDNVDVHLPDGTLFKPDLTVIKAENASIIDWQGAIYGVPDMVVEVFSKSTRKKDLNIKKDIYESNGVKEYWIVDPYTHCVDVYILEDEKFKFSDEYVHFTEKEWDALTEEEKAEAHFDIRVSIFDDLTVNVNDIFTQIIF